MKLTIKDIAKLTGTSPTAVSFVLNNKNIKHINSEKKEKILKIAEKYGYRCNRAAKGLALKRTYKISLCIYGYMNEFPIIGNFSFHEFISIISAAFRKIGYDAYIFQIDPKKSLNEITKILTSEDSDGIVFVKWDIKGFDKILFSLFEKKIPFVIFDSPLTGSEYDIIATDMESSFYQATSYLIKNKYKKILFFSSNSLRKSQQQLGYERAMREAGLKIYPIYSVQKLASDDIRDNTVKLITEHPDVEALIIGASLQAVIVLNIIGDRKIRFMSCGHKNIAEMSGNKLSYLKLPIEKQANECVKRLISQIETPDRHEYSQISFQCDLVIRQTNF